MGEIRSIPAGILSAAWLDCDKYSKIYAGIFASCMKSDQSFHTGSNPLARTASNTSAGVRESLTAHCSSSSIGCAYPPGVVFDPALMTVTPNGITVSRQAALSRVDMESSTSSLSKR